MNKCGYYLSLYNPNVLKLVVFRRRLRTLPPFHLLGTHIEVESIRAGSQ
jgi:hypothetical protein